jgi:hypothetical protein
MDLAMACVWMDNGCPTMAGDESPVIEFECMRACGVCPKEWITLLEGRKIVYQFILGSPRCHKLNSGR